MFYSLFLSKESIVISVICRPFLELTFQVYLLIGVFGLSYQIAILEDVLAIVSFHVYCIYVYAAW